MHTEQGFRFLFLNKLRGRHVRLNHALFNQLVCVITNQWHNAFDLALRVENKAGFITFKLHCATLVTRSSQRMIKFVQFLNMWH